MPDVPDDSLNCNNRQKDGCKNRPKGVGRESDVNLSRDTYNKQNDKNKFFVKIGHENAPFKCSSRYSDTE